MDDHGAGVTGQTQDVGQGGNWSVIEMLPYLKNP